MLTLWYWFCLVLMLVIAISIPWIGWYLGISFGMNVSYGREDDPKRFWVSFAAGAFASFVIFLMCVATIVDCVAPSFDLLKKGCLLW